ncbi:hypothetical protein AVEN_13470-1 [Araneus ventricosus]|uniref:Uncharacterized protein n=1 Tax=Araneus ventricosus TaxID=182803 RepID=A0A4Y2IVA3_ARAVE|nr:hypothetical protein AVEN_13470-1 [Araneus ventricosus]
MLAKFLHPVRMIVTNGSISRDGNDPPPPAVVNRQHLTLSPTLQLFMLLPMKVPHHTLCISSARAGPCRPSKNRARNYFCGFLGYEAQQNVLTKNDS